MPLPPLGGCGGVRKGFLIMHSNAHALFASFFLQQATQKNRMKKEKGGEEYKGKKKKKFSSLRWAQMNAQRAPNTHKGESGGGGGKVVEQKGGAEDNPIRKITLTGNILKLGGVGVGVGGILLLRSSLLLLCLLSCVFFLHFLCALFFYSLLSSLQSRNETIQ